MIKIENTEVYGWEAAIRGMRNPMNSWDRSDSVYCDDNGCSLCDNSEKCKGETVLWGYPDLNYCIGLRDMELMHKLYTGGPVHAKYLRMITVTVDITAPLYWWKEFDTYKVGTVANSCSTMHKIHAKAFELDDFSTEHLLMENNFLLEEIIEALNEERQNYLYSGDKAHWWQMIQLLPSSYNQKRTVQLNYEVLMNIYKWRKNHKLDEWHAFCAWAEELPYFKEIRGGIE